MQHIKFIAAGILFGIILTKGEVISWFRIQEMFRFQSFHMYGIIGSAVVLGAIGVALIKKWQLKSSDGTVIQFKPKAALYKAALLGGIIFGAGWAATGASVSYTHLRAHET